MAVEGTMLAKIRNMGESCCAANRIFVHASVAEEFASRLTARMAASPSARAPNPASTSARSSTTRGGQGRRAGARRRQARSKVRTGGELPDGPGYFYPPTVLTDVSTESAIMGKEIFGPVAADPHLRR